MTKQKRHDILGIRKKIMKTIIALTSVVVLNCYCFGGYEQTSMNTSSHAREANISAAYQAQLHFLIDKRPFEPSDFYEMFNIWKENPVLVENVLGEYKSNPESRKRLSKFRNNSMRTSISEELTPGVWEFIKLLNKYVVK